MPPSDSAGQPTGDERRAYLRWSCDKLFAALESENSHRSNTRTQAHACFLLIPALLVFVVNKDVPGGFATFTAASRVVMFVAAAVALVFWYRVMVTRPVPGVQLSVFTLDEEPQNVANINDFEYRYLRVRNNLLDTMQIALPSRERFGRWKTTSLRATVVTVVAAVAPYSLEPMHRLLESIR